MRHSCLVSALRFICLARELAGDAGDNVLNDRVETEVLILSLPALRTLSIRLVLAHYQLSANKRIIAFDGSERAAHPCATVRVWRGGYGGFSDSETHGVEILASKPFTHVSRVRYGPTLDDIEGDTHVSTRR